MLRSIFIFFFLFHFQVFAGACESLTGTYHYEDDTEVRTRFLIKGQKVRNYLGRNLIIYADFIADGKKRVLSKWGERLTYIAHCNEDELVFEYLFDGKTITDTFSVVSEDRLFQERITLRDDGSEYQQSAFLVRE